MRYNPQFETSTSATTKKKFMAKKTSMIPAVSVPTEGMFNNFHVLTLPDPDDPKEPGVQMGVRKLRAILNHVPACQAFVAKHHKPKAAASGADPAALKAAEEKVARLTDTLRKAGMSEDDIKKALLAA